MSMKAYSDIGGFIEALDDAYLVALGFEQD